MSYTEIFGFDKKGNAYGETDIKNAFRGAMAVWGILEEKYLPPYKPNYLMPHMKIMPSEELEKLLGYKPTRTSAMMDKNAMKEIWSLADDEKVDETDKICLFTTFDKCLVKREDIPKVVAAFREFEGETSLKEQADVLEKMYDDENCIAAGWNQTSVYEGWTSKGDYDEETDEYMPYNCLQKEDHYWLFD